MRHTHYGHKFSVIDMGRGPECTYVECDDPLDVALAPVPLRDWAPNRFEYLDHETLVHLYVQVVDAEAPSDKTDKDLARSIFMKAHQFGSQTLGDVLGAGS